MANKNDRRRGKTRNNTRKLPVISARDLDAQRCRAPQKPPQHVNNPAVPRIVRFVVPWTASSGTPFTQSYTNADIPVEDAQEYLGTNIPRYQAMRPVKITAWASTAYTSSATMATPGIMTELSIAENLNFGGAVYVDSVNPGVDYAVVSMRPSLEMRQSWYNASGTPLQSFFTVTINSPTPPGTVANGILTVDVTAEFQ